MKINKGQIVAITSGEYSDYCLQGHWLAGRDFDVEQELARFKKTEFYRPPPEHYFDGSDDRFIAWAVREELLVPLENNAVVELWIGAYGRLREE